VGGGYLVAHYRGSRVLGAPLKVLPILALAAAVAAHRPDADGRYAALVTAGLLASAVGDLCLVWPERFTVGLTSFLLAHCFYVAAFAQSAADGGMAWAWLLGIVATAGVLLAALWPHLGKFRAPVVVYVAVIAAMAWTAARRAGAPEIPASSAMLALGGAVVFMSSDGVLAIDRFARPFPAAHVVVMVTYYAAQTLIAASAVTDGA
jgi:uncharacterized membrane protein YhhN